MGSGDQADGEAFKANFTSEGVSKLRETVREKLKEFLGEYTDDTLVEYIIVLLKNGRRKEEAQNELDVFLGDDSSPFISWLWDHLGSHLHLYVQSPGISPSEVVKAKVTSQEPAVSVVKSASYKLDSGLEKGRSKESFKSHHPKELKGLEGDENEHQTLRKSIAESNLAVEDRHQKVDDVKRSNSLQEGTQRKRLRSEENATIKRDEVQPAAIAAPRRLLQFAVRDAVAKALPVTEPYLKRLKSVVSTGSQDLPLEEQSPSCQLAEKVSNNRPTAIVVDAAKDVKRVRPSRNVFDRLGPAADVSDMSKQLTNFGVDFAGDACDRPRSEIKDDYLNYHNKFQYKEQNASHIPLSHRDTEMVFDPQSKYDTYDDKYARRSRSVHVPVNGTSIRNKVDSSLMFQYNMGKSADRGAQETRADRDKLIPVPDTGHKTVNTSAGMKTWRSLQYQEMRGEIKLDDQKSELGLGTEAKKVPTISGNGIIKKKAGVDKEPPKMQLSAPGLSSTGPPIEDAESRTIFVSNVHFAATKDSLSRHFNKCGEVLKVLILTDPATGLPKGSACIEFMKIDAAANALLLDGTSFMSRILKVVEKCSVSPDVVSTLGWTPAARSVPFPPSGFGMIPFPRGVPNAYRGRPFKPGTRSLQWKRDVQSIPSQLSNLTSNTVSPRGLTYVRSANNASGSSSDA